MSGGYAYGDLEPKERCPYCSALCCADFVDVGVRPDDQAVVLDDDDWRLILASLDRSSASDRPRR